MAEDEFDNLLGLMWGDPPSAAIRPRTQGRQAELLLIWLNLSAEPVDQVDPVLAGGVVKAIVPKIAPGEYRLSKEFSRGEGISSIAHALFEVKP